MGKGGGGVSDRTKVERGARAECPKCHRWIGYWPDRMDYHVAHLMPHLTVEPGGIGSRNAVWCEGRQYVG